jgi:hypothetical protein
MAAFMGQSFRGRKFVAKAGAPGASASALVERSAALLEGDWNVRKSDASLRSNPLQTARGEAALTAK